MTREEAKTLLGENATEENIKALLDKFHENDNTYKKQVEEAQNETNKLKKQVEKYSDYDTIKSQLDEINKANMTKEEQLAEREKLIAEREKETNRRNNRSIVKEIVSGLNISDEVIESLVSDDTNVSKKNAENIVAQINTIKEATIKETKESLLNVDVKPDIKDKNIDTDVMDFEKFRTLSQEEQTRFAEEHPEEFKNL